MIRVYAPVAALGLVVAAVVVALANLLDPATWLLWVLYLGAIAIVVSYGSIRDQLYRKTRGHTHTQRHAHG